MLCLTSLTAEISDLRFAILFSFNKNLNIPMCKMSETISEIKEKLVWWRNGHTDSVYKLYLTRPRESETDIFLNKYFRFNR